MKKVYSLEEGLGVLEDVLKEVQPGAKFKWRNERRRYTCIDRSEHFIIVTKPYNLKKDVCQYSILDLTQMRCNRDNLIFGIFNYMRKDDCEEALEALERSLLPFEELWIPDGVDEDGRKKFKPRYEGADFTLEISQRGIADISKVITEIYI